MSLEIVMIMTLCGFIVGWIGGEISSFYEMRNERMKR